MPFLKQSVLFLLSVLLLSGCLIDETKLRPLDMKPEDLPDYVAFQDEFTRGFMKSTEEVGDGLYWFKSGTGKYEMLIPGGLQIDSDSYRTQDNDTAEFFLSGSSSEKGLKGEIQMEFVAFRQPDTAERTVEDLSERMASLVLNDRVEKIEAADKDSFVIQSDLSSLAETDNLIFYIVHIQNKEDTGSATIYYRTICEENTEEECSGLYQQHEDYIMKMIDTFTFIDTEEETDQ